MEKEPYATIAGHNGQNARTMAGLLIAPPFVKSVKEDKKSFWG